MWKLQCGKILQISIPAVAMELIIKYCQVIYSLNKIKQIIVLHMDKGDNTFCRWESKKRQKIVYQQRQIQYLSSCILGKM